jgi:hypothetical protein
MRREVSRAADGLPETGVANEEARELVVVAGELVAALPGGASRHAVRHAAPVAAAVLVGEARQRRVFLGRPRRRGPDAEDAPRAAGGDLMRRRLLTLAAAGGEDVEAEAISKRPGFSIALAATTQRTTALPGRLDRWMDGSIDGRRWSG